MNCIYCKKSFKDGSVCNGSLVCATCSNFLTNCPKCTKKCFYNFKCSFCSYEKNHYICSSCGMAAETGTGTTIGAIRLCNSCIQIVNAKQNCPNARQTSCSKCHKHTALVTYAGYGSITGAGSSTTTVTCYSCNYSYSNTEYTD
jgi:hypothetical protein